jgi:hypothetical protein
VLAGDLLLDVALDEAHDRDLMIDDELIDRRHIRTADPPQHRRRRDREPPIQQEPDHLALCLQPRHVPLQEQPVDRPDLEGHMIGE